MPTFCTAGGRAILARMPPQEAADIIGRSLLKPLTAKTITDPAAILDMVSKARADGFSLGVEESSVGELTLGVALLDFDGLPTAAIHIGASLSEWNPIDFVQCMAPLAIETARNLSHARTPRRG